MYIVSACLAGYPCRYDGKPKPNDKIVQLVNEGKAVPVCPEQLGGLCTPRTPCEILGGKVISKDGIDRTAEYILGAERTLAICKALNVDTAILKSNSPSCGYGQIYDGSFGGKYIVGNGITADLLSKNGITITNECQY